MAVTRARNRLYQSRGPGPELSSDRALRSQAFAEEPSFEPGRSSTGAQLLVFEPDAEGSDRGRAKWRYVTTGRMNDRYVELLDDPEKDPVQPGEIVLVSGHHTLQHDIPVRLVADAAHAAGARPQ